MATKTELEQKVAELEDKLVVERKLRTEFKNSIIDWLSINYPEMCTDGKEHIEDFCQSVDIEIYENIVLRVEAKTPFGIMPTDVGIYDENGSEEQVDYFTQIFE